MAVRPRPGALLFNPFDMHSHILGRSARLALASALLPAALLAQTKELPLKYVGPATKPEISAGDLMTRLYKFADDSMMGRQVGRVGNKKGTDYIAAEVKRLGLLPAGNNGTLKVHELGTPAGTESTIVGTAAASPMNPSQTGEGVSRCVSHPAPMKRNCSPNTRARFCRKACGPCVELHTVAPPLRTSATAHEGPMDAWLWFGHRNVPDNFFAAVFIGAYFLWAKMMASRDRR